MNDEERQKRQEKYEEFYRDVYAILPGDEFNIGEHAEVQSLKSMDG